MFLTCRSGQNQILCLLWDYWEVKKYVCPHKVKFSTNWAVTSFDTIISMRWCTGFILVPLDQLLVSTHLFGSQRILYWAVHWLGKLKNLIPYITSNDKFSAKRRHQRGNCVQALYAKSSCSIILWKIQLCIFDIKEVYVMVNINTYCKVVMKFGISN